MYPERSHLIGGGCYYWSDKGGWEFHGVDWNPSAEIRRKPARQWAAEASGGEKIVTAPNFSELQVALFGEYTIFGGMDATLLEFVFSYIAVFLWDICWTLSVLFLSLMRVWVFYIYASFTCSACRSEKFDICLSVQSPYLLSLYLIWQLEWMGYITDWILIRHLPHPILLSFEFTSWSWWSWCLPNRSKRN